MESMENQEISWNNALEKLLAEEGEKALGLAWLHNQCEAYYGARTNWITIPVIVLSTLSGTASASSTTFFAGNMTMGSLGIGCISILCGVLNTVSSYFAYAKRTEAHRIADIQFNKVYRFIAVEMTLPRTERIRARDMLKIVREQVERLAETSPPIPEFVVEKFKHTFRKDYKDVAQPDITNGLRRIKVNMAGVISPNASKTPMGFDEDSFSGTSGSHSGTSDGNSQSQEVINVNKEKLARANAKHAQIEESEKLASRIGELAVLTGKMGVQGKPTNLVQTKNPLQNTDVLVKVLGSSTQE